MNYKEAKDLSKLINEFEVAKTDAKAHKKDYETAAELARRLFSKLLDLGVKMPDNDKSFYEF